MRWKRKASCFSAGGDIDSEREPDTVPVLDDENNLPSLPTLKMSSTIQFLRMDSEITTLRSNVSELPQRQLSMVTQFRLIGSKISTTKTPRNIWMSLLLPKMISLPVDAPWTTFGYSVVFYFSLSLFGQPACTKHVDTLMQATPCFQHIDLALGGYYEAVGHKKGAQEGCKYLLAEAEPAYPIPGLRQWYDLITTGPPSDRNQHPIYHTLTQLVGWRHMFLVILELTMDEYGLKDFKGMQWDLNTSAGLSRVQSKMWTWRDSSRFLSLGTTRMNDKEIEAAARAHLKKYPKYHLVSRNCAFFVMLVLGAINSDSLGSDRRRAERASNGRTITSKLTLMLVVFLVVVLWQRSMLFPLLQGHEDTMFWTGMA